MPTYSVPLTGYANIAVKVETEETDPEKIVELAQENVRASLCHQCRGSESNDSLELGDDWSPVVFDGKPEVYQLD